jgi:hypothetical protein
MKKEKFKKNGDVLMKNTRVQLSKYIFHSTLIFTISLVMIISGSPEVLGNHTDQTDCTLKNPPNWDKEIERGGEFTITWDNPASTPDSLGNTNSSHCRYDVSFYHADKSDAGEHVNKINLDNGKWDTTGTKFFKICPMNDDDCKSESEFYRLEFVNTSELANTSDNVRQCTEYCDAKSQSSIIFPVVVIVVSLAITIPFIIKKKRSKKSIVPSSTEKPQEEDITYIDKQIALNEEKIKKIEEESKKLDEES